MKSEKELNEKLSALTEEELEQVNGGVELGKTLRSLIENDCRKDLIDNTLPSAVEHYLSLFQSDRSKGSN